jgi:putative transposase
MARKPRLHLVGGLYHVMLRGNNGKNIFIDNTDREFLENLVAEGVKRFDHKILAYCWMNNHIHLAIEVNKIHLSKIIQNLSFRYTRYINKKKKQVGHLFQGRYKAILVEKDNYLLELIRYIHLNPIRAKLVNKMSDYKWSSHSLYIKKEQKTWVEFDKVLSMFSKNKVSASKKYLQFLKEGADCAINFEIGAQDSRIIGDEVFVEKQVKSNEDYIPTIVLPEIIKSTCHVLNIPKNKLYEKTRNRKITFARSMIGYINKHYGKSSMQNLANEFALDISTLSRAITNLENKKEDQLTLKMIRKIKAELKIQ